MRPILCLPFLLVATLAAAPASAIDVDLSILGRGGVLRDRNGDADNGGRLDRARIVRALLDLAPNAWQVWGWVDAVVARLLGGGCSETRLAGSSAALIERLRIDVERERDRLAEAAFLALVALPSGVFAPVECVHGCQRCMACDWRARRSGVQPL